MKGAWAGLLANAALLSGWASPVLSQVGGDISITNDYRLRGYSLSRGHPAIGARIAYDDTSGLFADVSTFFFLTDDATPRWMGGFAAIGYARRLSEVLTFDAGLTRAQFSPDSSLGRSAGYTELFMGMSSGPLSARLAYSPDYLRSGHSTLYGSMDAAVGRGKWRAFGHVGALVPAGYAPDLHRSRTQYDWRGGAGRTMGPLRLELALTGGGPDRDVYDGASHSRTALIGSLDFAL